MRKNDAAEPDPAPRRSGRGGVAVGRGASPRGGRGGGGGARGGGRAAPPGGGGFLFSAFFRASVVDRSGERRAPAAGRGATALRPPRPGDRPPRSGWAGPAT